MNFRSLSHDRFPKRLSQSVVITAAMALVFVPMSSSQQPPRPPAWAVQSADPAHSSLTLKGSVILGIDRGMFWVVLFRMEGSGTNQLASFQPNMAVVLETSGPKLQSSTAFGAKTGGKAQPQTALGAKSPATSAVFTGIPTVGQTLIIQATGHSLLEGVVISVSGPQSYVVGQPGGPTPPCCAVTVFNSQTGIATAKVNANGQIFVFQAPLARPHEGPPPGPGQSPPYQQLSIGQLVWANLTTGEVSLDGKTKCCKITAERIPSSISRGRPPAVAVRNPIATGWTRYGKVASTFSGGIRLVPVASVVPSGVSASRPAAAGTANGGIDFPVPVNPPGQIKGTTRVWTTEALRGFEGSLAIFLLDENGQPVFQTSERHWGVNGQAIPGAPSDRTEDWSEPVPANAMALARKIVIVHTYSDYGSTKWVDTLIQGATDLGYVILGIGCLLIGNEVTLSADGMSCQPPSGGDSTDSSQAVATMTYSRQVPLQSPHSGQMVWVNPQTKQALWTAFPITAHRQDDLGNSHYLDTSVTVFYPFAGQPGTSPRAAGDSTLQAAPVVQAVGASAPCCEITGIDARARLAAAKENSTGQAFEFALPSSLPIENLHPGQPVWANFKAHQVSLDGKTACCEIVAGGFPKSSVTTNPLPVAFGGLWVPLGRVVSVAPNQLSIRAIVPSHGSSGGVAPKTSSGSRASPESPEGPTVTVGVEMASQPAPNKLATMAVREATTRARARIQSHAGPNTATPGEVMLERPVPPHPGQMVWVNRTTRQIRWVNFPFSMTQEDDLGDSHHLKTQISASLLGGGTQALVKGETRLWTFREIGGFSGRVAVTFADDMDRPLCVVSRPRAAFSGEVDSWHVCGHSEFWCGASDVTRDYGESAPADLLEQAAKVSIRHGAEDTLEADLLKIICDVVGCSIGNCSHPPSPQNPPSPPNADPCGPSTGTN